ncbi:hypothetical protein M407DRAFT_30014 [Tulasnella calospora MUT 4182]|uniref:Uncharacterized protein n=1 Tax=Tulasnella calospora MUT 4182 TaxID=1051891 RepID=A0A0C3PYI8_9AGAM|nr:hypothetical protein M407DRAFT_30014 [Tulasnella calospora MUT 4182]
MELARELARALVRERELPRAVVRAVVRAGWMRLPIVTSNLAKRLQVESSITRILLWVWEGASGTQLDEEDKRKIFVSSCRLWSPLETRVDFTINGIEWGFDGERVTFDDRNRDKLLTPDDMERIFAFAEDIQRDRNKSEFIARNADVGINRLYVHFDRRVDWEYNLYDLREQRTSCPRSLGKGIGMM